MTLVRQALKEHKGSKHPVAVLVRARSHLGNLTRRLTQEGISCRAVDLVPLALRPVVADLVQLLRALSHPADRLAWLSVLRAPFCGLTLTRCNACSARITSRPCPCCWSALREPDPESAASQTPVQGSLFDAPPAVREDEGRAGPRARDVLGADEYERLRQAAAVLLDARNDSGAMPFAAWVEACWRRLGGPALYTGLSVATTRKACSSWSSAWRARRDRHGRAGSRHRAVVRRA